MRGSAVNRDDGLELAAVAERRAAAKTSAPSLGLSHPPASRSDVLGRIGSLETRLARSASEVRQAQALRHAVFRQARHGETCAPTGDAAVNLEAFDVDAWDEVCDHLLVLDRQDGGERIVGTYRFLTSRAAARAAMPFYTAQEFAIEPLMARHSQLEFMELGRSCVLPQWRNKRTMELMWHGASAERSVRAPSTRAAASARRRLRVAPVVMAIAMATIIVRLSERALMIHLLSVPRRTSPETPSRDSNAKRPRRQTSLRVLPDGGPWPCG